MSYIMNINAENEWAAASGLLPIHLGLNKADKRFIMLDGGFYDFCLDLNGEDKGIDEFSSDAWSSNTKNYIHLSQEKITIHNWVKKKSDVLPVRIVSDKFSQFLDILNRNSYRTSDDVMPFVLSLFRTMRNQTMEKKEPLEALNLLYKLLISLEEDYFNADVCKKWSIIDVIQPAGFDVLVEKMKNGSRNITPKLDLILRHSSGVIFQEAHREALSFDYQYDLFGEMSSNLRLKDANLYSSIHYTPQYLARSIVEKALDNIDFNRSVIRIFDPACGSGAFLIEALNQLKEKDYSGHIEIDGWDSSPIAISTTKFLIAYAQRTQWSTDSLSFNIRQVKDSLQEDWSPKYDLILMNPPFLSMELIKNKEEKDAVNQSLSDLNMRKRPNESAAFLYKAVKALGEGGTLGIVLPSSILLSEQYEPLRNAIREQAELTVVARLGNYVFEDALTDVSFLLVRKRDNHSYIPETIWCKNNASVAYETLKEWRKMKYNNRSISIKNDFNIYTPSKFPIIHHTWKTLPLQEDNFIQKIEEWQFLGKLVPLQHIFDVRQGILTGCKDVFVISELEYKNLMPNEKKLFRPLASAETIENGHINSGKYLWYPYNSKGLIITSEEELQNYRNVSNILFPNKQKLMQRSGFKHKNWWELTRERPWLYVPEKYLLSKRFGNSSSFAINNTNYVIEEGNAFFFRQAKFEGDAFYFYLSLFSSSIFEHLLSIYAKSLLSGYDLGKTNIKDIPVPDVKLHIESSEYTELVELGKRFSKGEYHIKSSIDSVVECLYPYAKNTDII